MVGLQPFVATTIKAGIAIAALSVLAASWLAQELDRPALSRLAADATTEPATTGTLRERAAGTRLDPCAAPRRP